MAGKPIRLGIAASELNVGLPTLVDFLDKKGVKIDSNPNTRLEPEHYDLLCQEFAADHDLKKQSKGVIARREERESIALNEKSDEQKIIGGKPIRLGKAASELNVGLPILVDFLNKKGVKIDSNPNTRLEPEHFELLCQEFSVDYNLYEQSRGANDRREKKLVLSLKDKPNIENDEEEESDLNFEEIKRQVLGFYPLDQVNKSQDIQNIGEIDINKINQKTRLIKEENDKNLANLNDKNDQIEESDDIKTKEYKEPIVHSISSYKVQKTVIEDENINDKLSIGFSNFKRFENFHLLDLKAINFFVGPNNAGKSTAVKAYRLVSEYLKNVGEKFHLGGTWKNSANKWLNSDKMEFEIVFGEYQLNVSLFNNERGVEFNDYDQVAQVSQVNLVHLVNGASIEISFLQEHILIKLLSIEQIENDNDPLILLKEQFDKLNELINNFEKKRNFEYFRLIDERNKLEKKIKNLALYVNDKNKEEEFYNFDGAVNEQAEFYNFEGNEELEEENIDEDDLERNKFISIYFDKSAFTTGKIQLEDLLDVVNMSIEFEIDRLTNFSFDNFHNSSMDLEINDLEKIEVKIRQLKAIQYDSRLQNFYKDFSKRVKAEEVIYLGANLNKQSPLFLVEDKENQLSQAIHAFSEFKEINSKIDGKDKGFEFLTKWFNNFSIISNDSNNEKEIASDFEIVPISGVGYEFNLLLNNEKVSLSNMGMGTIQVATLLLRLATLIRKSERENKLYLVVVEEPELNLHPNFQSQLCDLFFDVNEKYPNIRFVIETHSEYIIRQSQKIIYNSEINNKFNTVYFPASKKLPYYMNYRSDGKFENEFEEGFFNVSTNQLFDIL